VGRSLNILIAPLEWGLGHATRVIPLARELLEMNNRVFIAGHRHLSLFRSEFPRLTCINFPGFSPTYSKVLPQYLIILLQCPLIMYHAALEHFRLRKIIRDHSIDIVISDNRFGLWNKRVRTAYITHMPVIPFPRPFQFLEVIGIFIHGLVIRQYDYCFIPDLPGEINLSGRLSHGARLPANVRYVGLLSRFSVSSPDKRREGDVPRHDTIILSGPEPQRSILRNKLEKILAGKKDLTVILGGRPDINSSAERLNNIIYYNHLPPSVMQEIIVSSTNIIARSGYTTIMELVSLNQGALLVPTPGQTEQEYLARYLSDKGWFASLGQSVIVEESLSHPPGPSWPRDLTRRSRELLREALEELTCQKENNRN
jgi:hypothetical protein